MTCGRNRGNKATKPNSAGIKPSSSPRQSPTRGAEDGPYLGPGGGGGVAAPMASLASGGRAGTPAAAQRRPEPAGLAAAAPARSLGPRVT